MPGLNPHIFPLVPYPGLAPELARRAGMGNWDAYALASPNDRLLPFVLSRRLLPSNAAWVSCAWLEHADTGERLVTLVPTGAQVAPATVPPLGLLLTKLTDAPNLAEHFTYDGALIPGLTLPCGVPLRLIVDNAYQSPRFVALAPAATLAQTHLPLEWYHSGPLQGVPYGRGFRQRFYLDNGSLQFLDPRREESASKDPDTGAEHTLSLSLFAQKAFTIDPVPAYLAEALAAAQAPRFFLAESEPWKLLTLKASSPDADGGRWTVAGTLESQEPLLARGCQLPALPVTAFDPSASTARGWRCGDTSDTASDFTATGVFSCEAMAGANTGYVLEIYRDLNRYSATYGEEEQRRSTSQDTARCPLPVTYLSAELKVAATRNDCPAGQLGSTVVLLVPAGQFTSLVSQAAADKQAADFADAQRQANANQYGTCTVGRRVALQNIAPHIKSVSFDLVRTDTVGDVYVRVLAQAVVNDGTDTTTRQFAGERLIADGSTTAAGLLLSYDGAVLVDFELLEISQVTPSDYLI